MRVVEDIRTDFGWLISPWVGTADNDVDSERLENIDINDDALLKQVIEADLVPWVKGALGDRRHRGLLALRHYLEASPEEVDRLFNGYMVALCYEGDDAKRIVGLIRDVFQDHQIDVPSE